MTVAALLGALCGLPSAGAQAALPDGRGYELVSPSAKLGNDAMADSTRTRAAAAEAPGLPMAATFASLGGFADAVGMGVSTEYLAQRTAQPGTSGWSTHAITPPQQPLSILAAAQGLDPLFEGDMSPDLTRAIFRAWSPVTDDPDVAGVANLYAREDLRQTGGAWQLLTAAAGPLPPIANGNQRPYLAGASSDLRHVIFESRLALTPGAAPGNTMLYKVDDGVVRLLAPGPSCPGSSTSSETPCSVAGAGATALRLSSRAISSDGSRVELSSPVDGLTSGVTANPDDPTALYQFDDRGTASTADDTLTQVNASEKTPPDPPQAARFETASRDGERVFFTSDAQLTNTPGTGLYLWRRTPAAGGGHLTLIGGGHGTAAIGVSADGRRVYFVAIGQLLPGGPPVPEDGVYLWQDDGSPQGSLSYVGAITFGDANANDNLTLPWSFLADAARVTPDGGELLFEVSDGSGLAPHADHGSCTGRNANGTSDGLCSELYLYRADGSAPLAPDVVCVSCNPSGAPAAASASVNVRTGAGAAQTTWHLSHALSDDGRRVFFSTAQPLVQEDVNGRVDAYEYDVPSGTLHLLSSGRDGADSWFLDASASGDDVFFATREQLVGWDTDASYDLYDARVGGGFPDPTAAGGGCTGEGCRGLGEAPPPPPLVTLASLTYGGNGNAAPPPPRAASRRAARRPAPKRCKRGYVRKRVHGKVRCVKRPRRKPAPRKPAPRRRRR